MKLHHRQTLSLATIGLLSVTLAAPLAVARQEAKPGSPTTPAPSPAPTAPEQPKTDDGTDPNVARNTKHYNIEKDTTKPAISGYDPVAYFGEPGATEGSGTPTKGDKKFAYRYRGVTYWFASQKNLDAFKKDPRKYEPAYGGWCAYAMGATGEKVEIDPKSFKITGGRLYLFYKDFFNDTRAKWSKDEKSLNSKADANWKKTTDEK